MLILCFGGRLHIIKSTNFHFLNFNIHFWVFNWFSWIKEGLKSIWFIIQHARCMLDGNLKHRKLSDLITWNLGMMLNVTNHVIAVILPLRHVIAAISISFRFTISVIVSIISVTFFHLLTYFLSDCLIIQGGRDKKIYI